MIRKIKELLKSAYLKTIDGMLIRDLLFKQISGSECLAWYIEINPEQIEYISLIPESANSLVGVNAQCGVLGGHWDYFKIPFAKHITYRTAAEVVNHVPYNQSAIFKSVKTGRRTKHTAISAYNKLANLRDRLLQDGYRSQYQLHGLEKNYWLGRLSIPRHEIIVGMDRNGKFMRLVGGKHRLAIAQNLGIKRIPAILSIVHEDAADMIPERSRLITGDPEDYRPFSKSSPATPGIPKRAFHPSL